MDTRQCLKILELENVTSITELKKAYRKMVQTWHPDRFHGDPRKAQVAEAKLKDINQAYKHCCAYFDPDQSKSLKTSSAPSNKKFSSHDPNHPSADYQPAQRSSGRTGFNLYYDRPRFKCYQPYL